MIFKKRKVRIVTLKKDTRDSILSFCKMNHPNEGILILRGKLRGENILIDGLVIPPFSEQGPTFAGFPSSFLPFDPSYVGTVHSHPIGSAEPSIEDLHNFFGFVSMIVKSPYENDDIFAWDGDGGKINITLSD